MRWCGCREDISSADRRKFLCMYGQGGRLSVSWRDACGCISCLCHCRNVDKIYVPAHSARTFLPIIALVCFSVRLFFRLPPPRVRTFFARRGSRHSREVGSCFFARGLVKFLIFYFYIFTFCF
jgi:hypothetical protein